MRSCFALFSSWIISTHVVLFRASLSLKDIKTDNFDQSLGVSIIREALTRPLRIIAENAGKEGGVIIGQLLDKHSGDSPMCVLLTFTKPERSTDIVMRS